jgi:hypothetical protein
MNKFNFFVIKCFILKAFLFLIFKICIRFGMQTIFKKLLFHLIRLTYFNKKKYFNIDACKNEDKFNHLNYINLIFFAIY